MPLMIVNVLVPFSATALVTKLVVTPAVALVPPCQPRSRAASMVTLELVPAYGAFSCAWLAVGCINALPIIKATSNAAARTTEVHDFRALNMVLIFSFGLWVTWFYSGEPKRVMSAGSVPDADVLYSTCNV